jgi:hypothetical protein
VISRRRFLTGAGGLAAGALAAGVVIEQSARGSNVPLTYLPTALPGLPERQHAWDATLTPDQYGNPIAPRRDRLLLFDVRGVPNPRYARLLEAELRRLEHAHHWSPAGTLFTIGWSPRYFEHVLRAPSPIPYARAMSDFEDPVIDRFHLCLHLASDNESVLESCERTLVPALRPILQLRQTRAGFVGAGLPAAQQQAGGAPIEGIPPGDHVTRAAPLFMGFKSSLKKNQASEDAVTILDGQFAQGTTMALSYMTLSLDDWYENLTYAQRVARMYSPQTSPASVARFTTDAESNPNLIGRSIKAGVIGHSQASAQARRNGRPLILRRDFNTIDDGRAGLHFVSLQRTIADFVTTRTAMNQARAQLQNPEITATVNNGINEFIFVRRRANFIVPPRQQRSFPLLPRRESLL